MTDNMETENVKRDAIDAAKKPVRTAFSARLHRMMLSKGWNQSELARRAGISRANVSGYAQGRVIPNPETVKALAQAFGVEPGDLFKDSDLGIGAVAAPSALSANVPFTLAIDPVRPDTAFINISRRVSVATALKIAELLTGDHTLDGEGSGRTA